MNDLIYSIQYETDDLLGAATELSDQIVTDVVCVSDLTLSKEYIDQIYGDLPDQVADAIAELDAAVAANRFVDIEGTSDHVSKTYNKAYPSEDIGTESQESVVVDFNADFLAVLPEDYEVGKHYRVEIRISVATSENINDANSHAEVIQVGVMGEGCSVFTTNKLVVGLDSLTISRAGETVNISFENTSDTYNKMLHVQAQLTTFNQGF